MNTRESINTPVEDFIYKYLVRDFRKFTKSFSLQISSWETICRSSQLTKQTSVRLKLSKAHIVCFMCIQTSRLLHFRYLVVESRIIMNFYGFDMQYFRKGIFLLKRITSEIITWTAAEQKNLQLHSSRNRINEASVLLHSLSTYASYIDLKLKSNLRKEWAIKTFFFLLLN